MKTRLAALAVATLLAAGCEGSSKEAPWLTMLDAAAHARNFPIAPGDAHDPTALTAYGGCNGCHADRSVTPSAPSATFKVFTCTNCHVLLKTGVWHDDTQAAFGAWHVAAGVNQFDATVAATPGIVGVAQFDAACRACHLDGIAVDHAVRFLLPHQDATATIVARCSDCHVTPGNRKVLGCAQCHPHDLPATATGHALVPGFVGTDSALCARCHEDGKIPVAVASHATGAKGFIVGAGVHSGAAGGACLGCHPQNRTTAPRTFVADFKVTTCVGCHVTVRGGAAFHDDATGLATIHAGEPAFATSVATLGLSAACLSCHADGQGGAPSNHELIFPRAAGTPHASVTCSQCHGNGVRTDLAALACVSCHRSTPALATALDRLHVAPYMNTSTNKDTRTLLDLASPAVCLRCHAPTAFNGATSIIPIRIADHAHDDSSINTLDHKNVGCVDCHRNTRTVEARYTAQDFDSGRRNCLLCHSSNNP